MLKLQDELTHQRGIVESLRVELDTATEAKNELEHRYGESLKEIETLKKERDEVKKACQVTQFNLFILLKFVKFKFQSLICVYLFSH